MRQSRSSFRRVLVVAALAAAGAGVAHADDSSLNPFTGESYAAFNGADRPAIANPQFDPRPSAWRQQNPSGLSERVFQSYSAPGENWRVSPPEYADAPAVASFRASHPDGLSEREFQALSSDGDAWQARAPNVQGATTRSSEPIAQSGEPPSQRLARLMTPVH